MSTKLCLLDSFGNINFSKNIHIVFGHVCQPLQISQLSTPYYNLTRKRSGKDVIIYFFIAFDREFDLSHISYNQYPIYTIYIQTV